jgi:hypothetical protein
MVSAGLDGIAELSVNLTQGDWDIISELSRLWRSGVVGVSYRAVWFNPLRKE